MLVHYTHFLNTSYEKKHHLLNFNKIIQELTNDFAYYLEKEFNVQTVGDFGTTFININNKINNIYSSTKNSIDRERKANAILDYTIEILSNTYYEFIISILNKEYYYTPAIAIIDSLPSEISPDNTRYDDSLELDHSKRIIKSNTKVVAFEGLYLNGLKISDSIKGVVHQLRDIVSKFREEDITTLRISELLNKDLEFNLTNSNYYQHRVVSKFDKGRYLNTKRLYLLSPEGKKLYDKYNLKTLFFPNDQISNLNLLPHLINSLERDSYLSLLSMKIKNIRSTDTKLYNKLIQKYPEQADTELLKVLPLSLGYLSDEDHKEYLKGILKISSHFSKNRRIFDSISRFKKESADTTYKKYIPNKPDYNWHIINQEIEVPAIQGPLAGNIEEPIQLVEPPLAGPG